MLAIVKKKRRTKKVAKKAITSRRKKTVKKKTTKKTAKKTKKVFIKRLTSKFKINKNNWIVLYYAVSYIGIFGLFALAIYFSN